MSGTNLTFIQTLTSGIVATAKATIPPQPLSSTSVTFAYLDNKTIVDTAIAASYSFIPVQNGTDNLHHGSSSISAGLVAGVAIAALVFGLLVGSCIGYVLKRSHGSIHDNHPNAMYSQQYDGEKQFQMPTSSLMPLERDYQQTNSAAAQQLALANERVAILQQQLKTSSELANMMDQLSQDEALRRVQALNESIEQMNSHLAIKASNKAATFETFAPSALPEEVVASYSSMNIKYRSDHFEALACALVNSILINHFCFPFYSFTAEANSALLAKIERLVQIAYDKPMATRWRVITHHALRMDKQSSVNLEATKITIQNELATLLLWCGMEPTQKAANRHAAEVAASLASIVQPLISLVVDMREKIVSSDWNIVMRDPINSPRLTIATPA